MAAEVRIPLTMEYIDVCEEIPEFSADVTYRFQAQGELNIELVESYEQPEVNADNGLFNDVSRVVLLPYQVANYRQSGNNHLWARCLGYKEENTFISVWSAQ